MTERWYCANCSTSGTIEFSERIDWATLRWIVRYEHDIQSPNCKVSNIRKLQAQTTPRRQRNPTDPEEISS